MINWTDFLEKEVKACLHPAFLCEIKGVGRDPVALKEALVLWQAENTAGSFWRGVPKDIYFSGGVVHTRCPLALASLRICSLPCRESKATRACTCHPNGESLEIK